jgi:hypothetical protein
LTNLGVCNLLIWQNIRNTSKLVACYRTEITMHLQRAQVSNPKNSIELRQTYKPNTHIWIAQTRTPPFTLKGSLKFGRSWNQQEMKEHEFGKKHKQRWSKCIQVPFEIGQYLQRLQTRYCNRITLKGANTKSIPRTWHTREP